MAMGMERRRNSQGKFKRQNLQMVRQAGHESEKQEESGMRGFILSDWANYGTNQGNGIT